MTKTASAKKTTLTITDDAHAALERWAEKNLTSLSAETTRAIRERAQRERAGAASSSR